MKKYKSSQRIILTNPLNLIKCQSIDISTVGSKYSDFHEQTSSWNISDPEQHFLNCVKSLLVIFLANPLSTYTFVKYKKKILEKWWCALISWPCQLAINVSRHGVVWWFEKLYEGLDSKYFRLLGCMVSAITTNSAVVGPK